MGLIKMKTDKIKIKLIREFGGIPQLARALGITRHAVHQWKTIPPLRAYQLEKILKAKFTVKQLLTVQFKKVT